MSDNELNRQQANSAVDLFIKQERHRIDEKFPTEISFEIAAQAMRETAEFFPGGDKILSMSLSAAVQRIVKLEDELSKLKESA
jgi:hypothetical protein